VPNVGLQLYTLRGECDRDLEGTLRRVGRQGYDGVEFFQLHGHEPARVRAWLDEVGLVAAGRHAPLEALENQLAQLSDELAVLGTDRVALSWIDPG
jgi:sugar phosphate isomerase/epimerase